MVFIWEIESTRKFFYITCLTLMKEMTPTNGNGIGVFTGAAACRCS